MTDFNISDNELTGIEDMWEEFDQRRRPLDAGTYTAVLSKVNNVSEYTTKEGRTGVNAEVNFIVFGGEFDGKPLNFQRLSIYQLIALFKSAGYSQPPGSPTEVADALANLADAGTKVKIRVNWTAFSSPAYAEKLMELTGEATAKAAKAAASGPQKGEAGDYATILSNYREFPEDELGNKVASVQCPYTDEKVTARAEIKDFA